MTEENQNQEQSQTNSSESIDKRFERERKDWEAKVLDMTRGMNNMYKLAEVLESTLSEMQIAKEYMYMLIDMTSKLNASYKKKRKDRYYYYTNECDQRFTEKMIDMNIDVDLAKDKHIVDAFNNHISYMKSTIDTLDKLYYGVNWRMKLEEYKVGTKI